MKENIKIKKRVIKSGDNKVERVMREFKEGKLKTSSGKLVTDHAQALAIALSEAGLSNKSLKKAEIRNKLKVCKSQLQNILRKEIMDDRAIKSEIIKLFKSPTVKDSEVHALAERLNIKPDEMEGHIYEILRSFLSGGKSKGKKIEVDPNELSQGISVEMEHSDDKDIAEKIARDHLAEDPKYYTKLKEVEGK